MSVSVFPGTSIQSVVNANPAGTTYLLKAGTHVQQSVIPKTGDTFTGETGTIVDGQNVTQFAFKGYNGSAWVNTVTISNLTITRYASPSQNGAIYGGDDLTHGTSGWVVSGVEVSYCAHYGVRIGNAMQVLTCNLHHNGTLNIGGVGSSVVIDGVISRYGNYLAANDPGFESGGSKFAGTTGLIVRNSTFSDNVGVGLWLDIENTGYALHDNIVQRNYREGICIEISYGGTVYNNTVTDNGWPVDPYRANGWGFDAGIGIHASKDVEVYGNTVRENFNGIVGIQQARGNDSLGQPYLLQNLNVHDNLVSQGTTAPGGDVGFSGIVQDVSDNACFTSRNNLWTHNTYFLGANPTPFNWLNGNRTKAQWQGYGQDTTGTFNYSPFMASPYLTLATDGTDLGANIATIVALTSVAASGDRRGVTEPRYGGSSQWFSYNSVQRVQYPRTLLNTDTFPNRAGMTVWNINSDAGLLALLSNGSLTTGAHIVVLDNTVVFSGNYYRAFPVRNGDTVPGGNNVVVFISKAIYDSMPGGSWVSTVCPPQKRVELTDLANLVEFRCTSTLSAFCVDGATNGWRFIGLKFTISTSIAQVSHLCALGNPDGAIQQTASMAPSNLGLDRCWFDGHASSDLRHAVDMHCKYGYMVDCNCGDNIFVVNFADGQPLCLYNGPGPYRFANCRFNGGVENVIIGGSASNCGCPADIEFRYCVFTRPTSWYGTTKKVKCAFEVKKAKYLIVEGCISENTWPAGQVGAGWLLKSESYGDGAKIGYTSDVLLQNNLSRNIALGYTVAGVTNVDPAVAVQRIVSHNNLYRVGGGIFDASQNQFIGLYLSQDSGSIHDTFISEGTVNAIAQPDTQAAGALLMDSIFGPTTYGLKGGSVTEGTNTISTYMPGGTVSKSVFTGRSSGSYPAGNYFPADVPTIQFTNVSAKDYSLLGTAQTGGGTVTPVATSLVILTQPSGGASGSALPTQPVLQIRDQFGNPFSSTATITATSNSGSVTETGNTKAAVAGTATFTALTPSAASTTDTTWTFTSPGLTSVTSSNTTVTVAVAARVATALRVVQQPGGSSSGVALTPQPSVEVIDQYGDRITSTATITANVVSAGPVTFSGGTTAIAAAGLATFTTLTASTSIEYHAAINFTSPGLTSAQSNYFLVALVVTPPPTQDPTTSPDPEPPIPPSTDPVPAALVVVREPGPAGKLYSRKKFPIQPIVEARDASNALMTSFNGQMTAYLDDGAAGTLIGTKTITAVGGVGRWTNLGVSGATGPIDILFVDGPAPVPA